MAKRNGPPAVHVTKRSDGNWQAKKEGGKRASVVAETKADAEKAGRQIAKNSEAELVVHRGDGTIERKDSHGHDPRKSKG